MVVVDDASLDPGAVAEVCRAHGARLVRRDGERRSRRRPHHGASTTVATDLVAFVDSDCTVPTGLARPAHVAVRRPGDRGRGPAGAAGADGEPTGRPSHRPVRPRPLAPRPRARRGRGRARPGRPLRPDRGAGRAPVGSGVGRRVRPRLCAWARTWTWCGGSSTPAGGSATCPSATVHHREPGRWRDLLARRYRYGTSAAPLAARHPGRLAPVELRPRPAGRVRSPCWPDGPSWPVRRWRPRPFPLARTVRPLGVPAGAGVALGERGPPDGRSWASAGRPPCWPGPVWSPWRRRGRRGRRAAVALVLVPPVVDWVRRRPDLDLPRWVAASVADDVAYGAGVWTGCLRERTFGPLLPTLPW